MPSLTILGICSADKSNIMSEVVEREARKLDFLKPTTKLVELNSGPNEKFKLAFNRCEACELATHFQTEFVLTVHEDGIVLNPSAWTDDFFNYDYLGAPWADRVVGNGGFCLRSKKLCEWAHDNLLEEYNAKYAKWAGKNCLYHADYFICRTMKDKIQKAGFKFAPFEVARKFSVEHDPYSGQLGAHHEIKICGKSYNLKKMTSEDLESLFLKIQSKARRAAT